MTVHFLFGVARRARRPMPITALALAVLLCASPAGAQRIADARAALQPGYPQYEAPLADFAHRHGERARDVASQVQTAGERQKPRLIWPYFALTGAVLGAGTVVYMALASCDEHCKDDGAMGMVPFLAGTAAAGGFVVGGLVGGVIDVVRRRVSASGR